MRSRGSVGICSSLNSYSPTGSTIGVPFKAGFHQFARHVSHQNRIIVLSKTLNRLEKLVTSDTVCLLFTRIADAANYTEEVQPYHSLLVIEFLKDAGK
jgi:hypothetical protein